MQPVIVERVDDAVVVDLLCLSVGGIDKQLALIRRPACSVLTFL
jgi:hypothetical protein